jgi:hypothetical protein
MTYSLFVRTGDAMSPFERITALLQEGGEWEARELFMETYTVFVTEISIQVARMLGNPPPDVDMDDLWERLKEQLREEQRSA